MEPLGLTHGVATVDVDGTAYARCYHCSWHELSDDQWDAVRRVIKHEKYKHTEEKDV